jgi:hypothetical protein
MQTFFYKEQYSDRKYKYRNERKRGDHAAYSHGPDRGKPRKNLCDLLVHRASERLVDVVLTLMLLYTAPPYLEEHMTIRVIEQTPSSFDVPMQKSDKP